MTSAPDNSGDDILSIRVKRVKRRLVMEFDEQTAELVEGMTRAEYKELSERIHKIHRVILANPRSERPEQPPGWAEAVCRVFADKGTADAELGDRREQFHRHIKQYGLARARRYYSTDVLKSVAPAAWAWAKRLGILGIATVVARKLGL